MITVSIALVGLRLRGQQITRAALLGGGCGIVCSVILLVLDWGGASTSGVGPALIFVTIPCLCVGFSLVLGWWRLRSRVAEPSNLRQKMFHRGMAAIGALSFSAALLLGASLTGMFWNTPIGGLVVFVSWVGPLFPIWRFVGPASVEIEQATTKKRLKYPQLSNRPVRAWWDTPWVALPAIAMCGFLVEVSQSIRIGGFEPLAVAIAAGLAVRHGPAALLPIGLGTFPFWLSFSFSFEPGSLFSLSQVFGDVTITSVGGCWLAVAALFWSRFANDSGFRARLLQRERIAWYEAAILLALFSLSLRTAVFVPLLGIVTLLVDPTPMLLSVSIIIAAGRMPQWPLLVGLAASAASVFVWSSGSLKVPLLDAVMTIGIDLVTALTSAACIPFIRRLRKPDGDLLRFVDVAKDFFVFELPVFVSGVLLGVSWLYFFNSFTASFTQPYHSAPCVVAALGFLSGLVKSIKRRLFLMLSTVLLLVSLAFGTVYEFRSINMPWINGVIVGLTLFAIFAALGYRASVANGAAPVGAAAAPGVNPIEL